MEIGIQDALAPYTSYSSHPRSWWEAEEDDKVISLDFPEQLHRISDAVNKRYKVVVEIQQR